MAETLFSIIIPHKNIPSLLQRCLDSIPQRDDVQIIIVDDNSNPQNVDFEKFPGLDKPNTEVYFDKSNKGAGRARNIGLKHARGEWLLFADADDQYEKGINTILEELKNEQSDLVFYNVISKDSETQIINDEAKRFSNIVAGNYENIRYKLLMPWAKAVRKSLVDNCHIRFEEIACSNDTFFSAMCDYYAKNYSVIPIIGYCWMTREGSLSRKNDIRLKKQRFKVNLRIARFMKTHEDTVGYSEFLQVTNTYLEILEHEKNKRHYLKALLKIGWTLNKPKYIFITFPHKVIQYFLSL